MPSFSCPSCIPLIFNLSSALPFQSSVHNSCSTACNSCLSTLPIQPSSLLFVSLCPLLILARTPLIPFTHAPPLRGISTSLSWLLQPVTACALTPCCIPCLSSHPFITGPCSVNPWGFCLFVLELLLQLATDPTYFLTSHLNSRAALQLLNQLT